MSDNFVFFTLLLAMYIIPWSKVWGPEERREQRWQLQLRTGLYRFKSQKKEDGPM